MLFYGQGLCTRRLLQALMSKKCQKIVNQQPLAMVCYLTFVKVRTTGRRISQWSGCREYPQKIDDSVLLAARFRTFRSSLLVLWSNLQNQMTMKSSTKHVSSILTIREKGIILTKDCILDKEVHHAVPTNCKILLASW